MRQSVAWQEDKSAEHRHHRSDGCTLSFRRHGITLISCGAPPDFRLNGVGVQGAHVVLCFVGIQALPPRTVGQRVAPVIWQKMQVELFAEREPCASPSRVCRTTGGACLLVVDTVASCGIEADHLV